MVDAPEASLFEVQVRKSALPPSWRANLERPDDGGSGRRVDVQGWVIAEHSPRAVNVFDGTDTRVLHMALDVERPDLVAAFPGSAGEPNHGFRGTLWCGTSSPIRLRIVVTGAGGGSVPMAEVVLSPRLQPPDQIVSVVVPCFNQGEFLTEAITSALRQTHPYVEVVVVDDGSVDNTSAVAASFPGIKVVTQPNAGLAAARNAGFRASTGAAIVFLDADDRLVPGAVERGLAELRARPECGAAFGWYRNVDVEGHDLPTPDIPPPADDPYEALLRSNWTGQPATAIYRRATVDSLGGFDERLDVAADYEFNLRVVRAVPVRRHAAAVVEYRQRATSMSTDPRRMWRGVRRVLDMQRPYADRDPRLRKAWRTGRRWWRRYYGVGILGSPGRTLQTSARRQPRS